MQPINYGAYPQNYPVYPNCFDNLTTNGIIAEDVVGYITDMPSPYLQNYVAQRGWAPDGRALPGQILPDPLPHLKNPQPLPKGDIYHSVQPKHPDVNTLVRKDKYDKAKKVALGMLLTGLAVFGAIKGKNLIAKLKKPPATTAATTATTAAAGTATPVVTPFYKKAGKYIADKSKIVWTAIKSGFDKVCDFVQKQWNKVFHKPATP